MNRKREPIVEVIARPGTDESLKRSLELASRARDFAMSDLGLPDNGSYRTFADLGRRYATGMFSPHKNSPSRRTWCFPVAGCVSYRGYFDEKRGRARRPGSANRATTFTSGRPQRIRHSASSGTPCSIRGSLAGYRGRRLHFSRTRASGSTYRATRFQRKLRDAGRAGRAPPPVHAREPARRARKISSDGQARERSPELLAETRAASL